MKTSRNIILSVFCLITALQNGSAASFPVSTGRSIPVVAARVIMNVTIKQVEQFTGRKLVLKEKLALKLLQWKLKKELRTANEKPARDPAKTAMILGIIGLAALFVPVINLASLPLAILAIVIGNKAKRTDPGNKKAKTAVTLGLITLGLLVIVGIIAALVIGFGYFGPH